MEGSLCGCGHETCNQYVLESLPVLVPKPVLAVAAQRYGSIDHPRTIKIDGTDVVPGVQIGAGHLNDRSSVGPVDPDSRATVRYITH